MSEQFINMISIIVYQDDILVLTSSSFDNHLRQLGNVFKQLHHNNHQVNADKSSFCALETKCLGFILTRKGIKPQTKGQCNPSSCTTSQCQTSLILCWHAEPSQSNDSSPLQPSNATYCTYQEEQ
jgi:hypothetical protein